MIFSDECHFQLNECHYGWSPKGTSIAKKSRVYNPKVQVWGSISSQGPVFLTFYEETLKSKDYVEILQSGFIPAKNSLMGNNWVFQQDGVKPHIEKIQITLL